MPAERRKNARLGLAIPVRVQGYRSDGSTWEEFTTTDDVSLGGSCFALSHDVELGQILFLQLALPKRLRQFDLTDATYRIYTLIRSVRRRPDQPRVGVMYFGKYPPRGFHDRPGARYLLPTDTSNGAPAPPSLPTPPGGTEAPRPPSPAASPSPEPAPPEPDSGPSPTAGEEPDAAAPPPRVTWGTDAPPPPPADDPYPEPDEAPSFFAPTDPPASAGPVGEEDDAASYTRPIQGSRGPGKATSPADSQPRVANWGLDAPPPARPGIPPPPAPDAPAVEFHPSREVPGERRTYPRIELFVNFVIQQVDEWGAVLQEELTVADNVSRGGARVMTTLGFGEGSVILLQEAGGGYATRAEVRGVTRDRSGTSRLHLRFIDREAPERILKQ